MNKAFEKILEELDKLREIYDDIASIEMSMNGHNLDFEYNKGKKDVMLEVKQIVQKVAEEYNNGWIPCSERLPEYDEEYYKKNGTYRSYIVMNEKAYAPSVAYYTKDKLWFYDDMIEFKNVVAWQPLPGPYQPKGE